MALEKEVYIGRVDGEIERLGIRCTGAVGAKFSGSLHTGGHLNDIKRDFYLTTRNSDYMDYYRVPHSSVPVRLRIGISLSVVSHIPPRLFIISVALLTGLIVSKATY